VEDVEQVEERSVIRLGTSKEMPSQKSEKLKKSNYEEIREEEVLHISEKEKLDEEEVKLK